MGKEYIINEIVNSSTSMDTTTGCGKHIMEGFEQDLCQGQSVLRGSKALPQETMSSPPPWSPSDRDPPEQQSKM